jgi:serine/threonine-protein kinase RsbW
VLRKIACRARGSCITSPVSLDALAQHTVSRFGQALRAQGVLKEIWAVTCSSVTLPRKHFSGHALARPEEIGPLRTGVWQLARGLGVSEGVANAIRVAVSEAITNVVMHAYVGSSPGAVTVDAWLEDADHFTVRVLDEGHGLIPRADSPGLGLGMGLMAQMADDFRVANREGTPGTTVLLRFLLDGSGQASPSSC